RLHRDLVGMQMWIHHNLDRARAFADLWDHEAPSIRLELDLAKRIAEPPLEIPPEAYEDDGDINLAAGTPGPTGRGPIEATGPGPGGIPRRPLGARAQDDPVEQFVSLYE